MAKLKRISKLSSLILVNAINLHVESWINLNPMWTLHGKKFPFMLNSRLGYLTTKNFTIHSKCDRTLMQTIYRYVQGGNKMTWNECAPFYSYGMHYVSPLYTIEIWLQNTLFFFFLVSILSLKASCDWYMTYVCVSNINNC